MTRLAMNARARALVLGCSLLGLTPLVDCASLEPLEAATCGNGVVDPGEDCDSFPAHCGGSADGALACRVRCGEGLPACPAGWGCSVDGSCRAPSGAFAEASEPLSTGVTTMLVADFDGDGRDDVLGMSGPSLSAARGRVHYFGAGGALSFVDPIAGLLTSPYVDDVDGDQKDDLAFGYSVGIFGATAAGLGLMYGRGDRSFSPEIFPSFTLPNLDAELVAIDTTKRRPPGTEDEPGDGLLAVATFSDGGSFLMSLDGDPATGKPTYLVGLPGAPIGHPIESVIFDADPSSTCGEIVLAFAQKGASSAQILSPCGPAAVAPGKPLMSAWRPGRAPQILTIPEGAISAVAVADVDGDGHQDVLLAGKETLYVARNATGAPPLEAPKAVVQADLPATLREAPLVTADLNGDRWSDYVMPSGVVMSQAQGGGPDGGPPASVRFVLIPSPTKRWTDARVDDVNQDGALDVVGASSEAPDIDVLEGTKSPVMPPFTVSTAAPVTQLAVGDFDLDGVHDIAFVEQRPAEADADLAIAYGELTFPPAPPREIGQVQRVRQLMPGLGGMIITTRSVPAPGEASGLSFSVLLSSGERQPLAPLLLVGGSALPMHRDPPRDWVARAVVAAPASAQGEPELLTVALGHTPSNAPAPDAFGLWLAKRAPGETFAALQEVLPLDDLAAPGPGRPQFAVRAGDIDGDALSELVAVAPAQSGQGANIHVVRAPRGSAGASLASTAVPGVALPDSPRVSLLDVDGDGANDLATILSRDGVPEVHVFFNDGAGSFAVPGSVIPLPAEGQETWPLGFAWITTQGAASATGAGEAGHELAVVTPKHLYRATLGGEGGARSFAVTELLAFGRARLNYGSDVVSGDLDGDGVEDLAVADRGSIRVLLQRAVNP